MGDFGVHRHCLAKGPSSGDGRTSQEYALADCHLTETCSSGTRSWFRAVVNHTGVSAMVLNSPVVLDQGLSQCRANATFMCVWRIIHECRQRATTSACGKNGHGHNTPVVLDMVKPRREVGKMP